MEGEDVVTSALGNLALFGATLGIFAAFRSKAQPPLPKVDVANVQSEYELLLCRNYLCHHDVLTLDLLGRVLAECALARVSRNAHYVMAEALSRNQAM